MIQCLTIIFQMGWFNHQLVFYKALFSVAVKNTVDAQGKVCLVDGWGVACRWALALHLGGGQLPDMLREAVQQYVMRQAGWCSFVWVWWICWKIWWGLVSWWWWYVYIYIHIYTFISGVNRKDWVQLGITPIRYTLLRMEDLEGVYLCQG